MIGMVTKLASTGALALVLALPASTSIAKDVSSRVVYRDIGMTMRLSRLSRQFVAQTPYVVNFDFDEYYLDDVAKERLDAQAAWININPVVVVGVFGHTDLMGSNEYNKWLGRKRAETVIAYLVSRGVHRDQVKLVESLGEEAPIYDVVARNRDNRRATTYVYGIIPVEHTAQRTRGIAPGPATSDTVVTVTTASTSVNQSKGGDVAGSEASKPKEPTPPKASNPTPPAPKPPKPPAPPKPPVKQPEPVVQVPVVTPVPETPKPEPVCRRVENEGQTPRFVEICTVPGEEQ